MMAAQVANQDAERQLFRYDMPEQERGMTDLLDAHKAGMRFQYVALTGADVEDHSARIRRLISLTPKVSKSEIAQKNLPRIRLVEDAEKFSLSQAIPRAGREFILLNKATIVFTPLTSFADDYSVLKVCLMDMRMRNRQLRASVKTNTNIQVKMEFALDHCIPRKECENVFLQFIREQSTMVNGSMWGVVQVQLELIESDYPFIENMKEVVGVLSLPSSGLDKFEKDPMHLDITTHNNHRMKMQDLYQMGDITDETTPMVQKTGKLTYAKSSAPAKPALKAPVAPQMPIRPPSDIDWSDVHNAMKPQIPDDQVSIDVEESDPIQYQIPSSSKGTMSLEEDDDDDEEDIPMPPTPPKRKSVSFGLKDV